ncbi:MAG: LysR substrate-binding domain-containing protein [Polyangiaceae bacterium]
MESLGAIVVFVRAAEHGSFTRAAQALGMTPSGVGKAIGRMEAELGVRLLHRTTRRVSLTDDGAAFYERCRRGLAEITTARDEVSHRSKAPRGRLRVSVPATLGRRILVPALPRFFAQCPAVSLELRLTDRRVSLVEDGVDVALRVGPLADASLVARAIGQQRLATIASPSYLGGRRVEGIAELSEYRCLTFRLPSRGRERAWVFQAGGRMVEVRPRAFLVIDDGEALVGAAAAGLGICQIPRFMAHDELSRGAVVEVLAGAQPPPEPISAVMLSQRNLPARSRAFIDFLATLPALGGPPPRGPDEESLHG